MFGRAEASAQAALDAINDLVTYHQYEYQRAVANMQLIVRELQLLADIRKITPDVVNYLEALHTNVKHPLRNTRHELGEAEDILSDAQRVMLALDLKDEW